jgi:hypothetical protein
MPRRHEAALEDRAVGDAGGCRVRQVGGPVVREEMLWARDGWRDDARDPIDATGMTGPLTARVDSIVDAPNGDCVDNSMRLTLEDAAGATRSVELGSTTGVLLDLDHPPRPGTARPVKPGRSDKRLYAHGGDPCGGLRLELTVRRRGDRLEVVETWVDEESGQGTEVALAALLPADAELKAR